MVRGRPKKIKNEVEEEEEDVEEKGEEMEEELLEVNPETPEMQGEPELQQVEDVRQEAMAQSTEKERLLGLYDQLKALKVNRLGELENLIAKA